MLVRKPRRRDRVDSNFYRQTLNTAGEANAFKEKDQQVGQAC